MAMPLEGFSGHRSTVSSLYPIGEQSDGARNPGAVRGYVASMIANSHAPGLSRRELVGIVIAASLSGVANAVSRSGIMLRAPNDRAVSVSVRRASGPRLGTILFSHGALSAPWKYLALIDPWVFAGYDVFAPLHVDSIDHPDTTRYPGYASWRMRMEDMHLLADHVGERHYVAAGHSFGALVALTLGGAAAIRPDGYAGPMADPRARAVVAFSPPGPLPKLVDAAGYAALTVPALIETGDRDVIPAGGASDWHAHLTAYLAPAVGGHRYGLVLEGVDHFFGNIICSPERTVPPQAARFADAVAVATLFLDAYGRNDLRSRARLDRALGDHGPVRLMSR